MKISSLKLIDWKILKRGHTAKGFCGHIISRGEMYFVIPNPYQTFCVGCGIKIILKTQKDLWKLFYQLLKENAKEGGEK